MGARHHQLIAVLGLLSAAAAEPVRWRERAPLPEPRAGYIAGTDGARLLLAGGTYWIGDRKHWSRNAAWYDAAADRWTPAEPLPDPRSDAGCAVVDGSVYVFGGADGARALDDVLMFQGGRWSALKEWALPAPRIYPVAALLERSVFVAGGLPAAGDYAGASASLWSRAVDGREGWRIHAEIPGPPRVHFALAAFGGRLYLFGGMTERDGKYVNLADAYVYDPGTDRWAALPEAPAARRAWWALAWRSRILLLGGYTDRMSDEVYSFDPRTRRYALEGRLPRGVADAKFVAAGGRILSAGGESGPKVRAPWTWVGTAPGTARTVVAFGDSVTVGARVGLVTPAQTYSARLQELLGGATVVNAGVGGNDTGHLLARLDRDVLARRPDLVIIMVGLNDAAYVDPGPRERTGPRISAEQYRRNLVTLIGRIRGSGAAVLLATPNPVTRRFAYSNLGHYRDHDINESVAAFRDAMLRAGREQGVPVADLFAAWHGRPDLDQLLVDGVHPGVEGHSLIAAFLLPWVEDGLR